MHGERGKGGIGETGKKWMRESPFVPGSSIIFLFITLYNSKIFTESHAYLVVTFLWFLK